METIVFFVTKSNDFMEKLFRKTNMTYKQSLLLCQRRRPVVDPIPSFCDQLRRYETECREWGYLTAVDAIQNVKQPRFGNDQDAEGYGNAKAGSSIKEKRKADSTKDVSESDIIEKKKIKLVGPMPPQKLTYIGPAKHHDEITSDLSKKKLTSSMDTTKPLIGHATVTTSIGPTKPNESSPSVTNKTSNKSSSNIGQTSKSNEIIRPSMPPPY